MTKPRIVFLSRKWPPAVGGMETYAIRLTEALRPRVDLTTIVLPGRDDGQPPGAIALFGFGTRSFFRIFFRHRDADVIHVADMASWPIALAASRKAAIVLSAHGTDVSYPRRGTFKGRAYGSYLRLGAKLLPSAIVVTNSSATDKATREYGFTQTAIVPLATNMQRQPSRTANARLLFSGRLTPRKGLSWFVAHVLDRLPEDITLDVAGTVWDKAEERALAHQRVNYIGHLDHDRIAAAYADALAVVVPNVPVPTREFEGFGLVAVEAAAAGGVVLASDEGGLSEAVRDGETGYSLPAGDADAWAEAIARVRNWTDSERKRFTDSASETARRVYAWDRVADQTMAAYQTATEARRP
ncbi:MAG: glycosyltransferase [Rhodobacteraceae bacterium]|nr:MAG: glycosyltransferase [Paracoccaceae bacterium]